MGGVNGTGPDGFDAVVFAGGGSRCFWQLGFWEVAAPELGLAHTVRQVAGVSAGAAMACAALLDKCRETLDLFKATCARNPKNAYPGNLLRGERIFPHEAMYRAAILEVVDREGLAALQRGPELRVAFGRPPGKVGGRAGLLLGLACYLWGRRTGDPVHGGPAQRLGFGLDVASVRTCRTPEDLADLVLASSCTPPFTAALRRDGRPVIDGGVVESAPLAALEPNAARTLVLLSRAYGTMPPDDPGRVYVGPSRPVPVSKWDYTNPRGLQQAYDLGRRDADHLIQ